MGSSVIPSSKLPASEPEPGKSRQSSGKIQIMKGLSIGDGVLGIFPGTFALPTRSVFPSGFIRYDKENTMKSLSRNYEEGSDLTAEIHAISSFLREEICPQVTGADPIFCTSGGKPGTVPGKSDTRNDWMTFPFVLNYPRMNNSGDIPWT